jgi:phosphoribosylglycinamide formyltransferase-1
LEVKKIAILASGRGTNAQRLIHHWQKNPGIHRIELLITDNPEAEVIKRAEGLGMSCKVVPYFPRSSKTEFEQRLLSLLQEYQINWLFLAGFMRILSSDFLENFYDQGLKTNRVVNIHPSLLPSFKGKEGLREAFEYGVKIAGITIHFVEAKVDQGPIIAQRYFYREDNDDLEAFIQRAHQVEYQLYPEVFDLIRDNLLFCEQKGQRKYVEIRKEVNT